MAYNNNIPQPTDLVSQSQADLLGNFQAIATAFNLNHVNFNAGAQGKHAFVEMPSQSPVPTTVLGEVGLYAQLSTLTNSSQLVFASDNNGPVYEFTSSLQATTGWSRLPSGILLKWGTATASGSGAYVVTFPVASNTPVNTAVYVALLTPASNIVVYQTSLTTTTLTVNASGAGTFNYLVIGL